MLSGPSKPLLYRTGLSRLLLSTEYEQLLQKLIDEKKAKLESIKSQKGKERQVQDLLSEIRYIELEIERYSEGLSLFRSKHIPKVGRWGKPEEEEHHASS